MGVDPTWEAIEASKRRTQNEKKPALLILATSNHVPLPNVKAKTVIALGVLFHLSPAELTETLFEIYRVLTYDGVAILQFLGLGDWRQQLGRAIQPDEAPLPGYSAILTSFSSGEMIRKMLAVVGFTIQDFQFANTKDTQGERRDLYFYCTKKVQPDDSQAMVCL